MYCLTIEFKKKILLNYNEQLVATVVFVFNRLGTIIIEIAFGALGELLSLWPVQIIKLLTVIIDNNYQF